MLTARRPVRPRGVILQWARRQRDAQLSPEQIAAMDSVYPEWRNSKDDVWDMRLAAVEAFYAANGRYPSQRAVDPDEKLIGYWLKNNKPGGAQSTPERVAAIDEKLPGWRITRDGAWAERLHETANLVDTIGRLPLMSGGPEESRARKWLNHQYVLISSGPADRLAKIDARIPGWRERKTVPGELAVPRRTHSGT